MKIDLPDPSLLVLVGPHGSGKTTFASRNFDPTQILSINDCRALVGDDAYDLSLTDDALVVLRTIVDRRLAAGRTTVVDAPNDKPRDRRALLDLARKHNVFAVAVVFLPPQTVCLEWNLQNDAVAPPGDVKRQWRRVEESVRTLPKEGFQVHVLRSPQEISNATVEERSSLFDLRQERGPFDIIGNAAGRHGELLELLKGLGYDLDDGGATPPKRRALFLGDAGATTWPVHELIEQLVKRGLAVPLYLPCYAPNGCEPYHVVLDEGRLALRYPESTGLAPKRGAKARPPVFERWDLGQRSPPVVVDGHTPVAEPTWIGNTAYINTNSGPGRKLTALRFPEREFVTAPVAAATLRKPSRDS